MNRILSIAILLLVTASAFATDRFNNVNNQDLRQTPIATTGRILRIDLKNRTLKVRGAESQSLRNVPEIKESLWQRLSARMPSVRKPSIAIALPGHNSRSSSAKSATDNQPPNEFMVVTADDTVFQDGVETLRLEDFRAGETISIHGVLSGSTVNASRIAKWD
jgi:hypothetical protein